ncbi:unnamed protein product [Pieris brassicae]|uniref:Uncharacterized protein n=1 Tax=Pieris brassicae TaxID=7116 RepID=A0A9P0XEU1_PIEBR|nr:unnamed protein product [Pieris brassicae]
MLSVIKSKLSGAAVEAIAYETNLDTWNNIKTALIRRKLKNENAESFGKRLRELLDTLLSIGNHANKGYYEEMVIEQYVNNLDFHVSLGVRIARGRSATCLKPGPSTFSVFGKGTELSSHSHTRLPLATSHPHLT